MNKFDRLISYFSPEWALKRQHARALLKRTMYAAAKTDRLTGSRFGPADQNVNEIIFASLPKIRQRTRQLVRDNSYFWNAVDKKAKYLIGPGFTFQSKIKDNQGKSDKKKNRKIEERWKYWEDRKNCHRAQKMDFVDILDQASRSLSTTGEIIIYKHIDDQGRLSLQTIESDRLNSDFDYSRQVMQGNNTRIESGIEYDVISGRVLNYHINRNDGYFRTTTDIIPADQIIHAYKIHRPDQLRGIPDLTASLLMSDAFHDMFASTLANARLASKWLAFITDPNPWDVTDLGSIGQGLKTDDPASPTLEIDDAIIQKLNPGQSVDFATANRPGDNFFPFFKMCVQQFGITSGIPYELLSGDYQKLNYSTMKVSRHDFRTAIIPEQSFIARHICNPIQADWLRLEVLRGDIKLPIYRQPGLIMQRSWLAPQDKSIDILRDTKSNLDAVAANLKSPQEIIADRNRDPEDVLAEIHEWKQMVEEYGISAYTEKPSTALANNPSAVEEQKTLRIVNNAITKAR